MAGLLLQRTGTPIPHYPSISTTLISSAKIKNEYIKFILKDIFKITFKNQYGESNLSHFSASNQIGV